MDKQEAEQLVEVIENNEDLGTEENDLTEEELAVLDSDEEELTALSDDEEDYDDEDFDEEPEREVIQVTETVQIVSQPVITTVSVGAEVGSKGEVKPNCKISVERHIEGKEDEIDVLEVIAEDFESLSNMVKTKILGLKKSTNPRSEMN
jgi:hypothetical protein